MYLPFPPKRLGETWAVHVLERLLRAMSGHESHRAKATFTRVTTTSHARLSRSQSREEDVGAGCTNRHG